MNKKYWLRWGTGLLVVYIILRIIVHLYYLLTPSGSGEIGSSLAILVIDFPGLILTRFVFDGLLSNALLSYVIFSIPAYFLIGALLGWLYGKIKNRRPSLSNA